RTGDEEHLAGVVMHHIVADGWSVGGLIRDIASLYRAFAAGEPSPLPELPLQYADFAVWQRGWLQGDVLERQTAWWRERLASAPPLLELPADRPRPPVQRFRGGVLRRELPEAVSRASGELCRREGVTPFMALLAGFDAWLHRITGREDVLVGTPVAGRDRLETEGLIGFFLNTLVLRTALAGDPDFRELLARVREGTLAAFAHQDLPFEKLVEELAPERNLSHAPLYQVMLVFQNIPRQTPEAPGLALVPVELETGSAKLDLTLNAQETHRGLLVRWLSNRDLFDAATVERFAGWLETLLAAAVADPGRRISELPLLTTAEERQLLAWNATAVDDPTDVCLHELIAAQVERSPGRIAVTSEGEALTYRGLSTAAGRFARQLRELGVGPEVPVGVCAERSLELVVALLAILQAGGAYLPLDPDDPAERLEHALADSGVPVLLTQERLLGRLPAHGARTLLIDDAAVEKGSAEPPSPDSASGVEPGNLAYVIYTSGSTGRPKGTMNTHRGIVNRLLWMQEAYGLGADDRVLQKTPFSFDVSVWEFFWPLLTGSRLVMARSGGHKDSGYLVRTIIAEEITTLHFVPSMLQVFVDAPGVEGCASLQRVICSGEALSADLQHRFFSRLGARLYNLYGPTEAAVDVTHWTCEREGRRGVVPIGHPVANTQIWLLDASLHQVPVGVAGELHIGGIQVGRGYWNRPDLTAERFIPDPFSPEPGARLYKTGDLARRLPDGAVDFLGRIDHQVKVRGLRIELGEIEVALAAQPSIREAVVLARRPEGSAGTIGAVELVAYVIPAASGNGAAPAPTLAGLRESLARSLPEHMLPTALVVLDAFPLTSSGKTDRRALSRIAPERPAGTPAERVKPRTELERFLAGLWSETLGGLPMESFGIHDSFFDLGGNSITGAILVNRLQKALGEIVHVVAIFDTPTIAGLAGWLAAEYPDAVARIWGPESLGDAGLAAELEDTRSVDEERLEEVRWLIRPLAPDDTLGAKNPPAVFVLSPPRSGSTLLRVMLAGNPRLFAPPELELLNFNTLAERRDAFPGRDAFRLEGLLRAVMEVRGCGPDKARDIIDCFTASGLTTRELYRTLQEWIGDRLLVDKTPTYAWDPATLRRAETAFEGARYIHLVRHPYGMIHSFEEARIDQIFFHEDHPFTRRELAEALWVIAHRNILDLLDEVPGDRQLTVRFEDLLANPESELRRICDVLGVDYHPDMAMPYKEKGARMTDGLHAESRMLGDVKFHEHKGVEQGVADRWRESYRRDFLGDVTWRLAARLGYDVERERVGASRIPSSLVKLRPGTTRPPLFLVHPVSGELLLYRHLVNALGPDREVYGFQAQGFHEGEQPLETLEEMADLYVEVLLAVQPEGPCLLAGSSMGGLLAFEIARRLRALGREVALTALLDAPDPAVVARETRDAEGEAELDILRHATGGKASLSPEDLRGLTPDQRLELVLEKGREAGGFGAGIGPAELRRLVHLVEANRRALRAYHSEPADLRVVYIRAAQGVRADAAWEPLALGGVEVHEIPGSHLSMHLPPHAGELAEILRRSIGERLEEAQEEDTAVPIADAGQEVEVGELGLEC
ncbi:MAG TPA: amino acid adenylation domain-containing protein, partial [Thermoanaerobaculia bacterium]|nr:amino acid adenylation domain-containing protein [Thermoanaerobaculia bacterium]